MKIRYGFVSNSSTSSFTCSVCGEKYEGWDASPGEFDCCQCPNEHIMCNSHLEDVPEVEPLPPKVVNGCDHEFDRAKAKFCVECGEPATVEVEEEEDEGYGYGLSVRECPVCRFISYAEDEMVDYLEKTRKVPKEDAFAKVKTLNKRRRKLYDSEYIAYVCEKFGLDDDKLLAELREKFKNWDEYKEFLSEEE